MPVISGPIYGIKFSTPEIKAKMKAYFMPSKKKTINDVAPTNRQVKTLAPNQPETLYWAFSKRLII